MFFMISIITYYCFIGSRTMIYAKERSGILTVFNSFLRKLEHCYDLYVEVHV